MHLKNETNAMSHKNNLSLKNSPSIRQLRAFTVLYETGSVSAAANILALTQPAITVLLRELEAKLGVRLFERSVRGLQRTEAAIEAMIYVQRVLGDLHEMSLSMQALASGSTGELRIAATSTVAQTQMPSLLQRFKAEHPSVRVCIDDCGPNEFVDRVMSERVHIGIGTLETAIPGLSEINFQQDWLHAVFHKDLATFKGNTVSWKKLEQLPIITVKPGYGVRRSIDQAIAEAKVRLNLIHEVTLLSTALALAEQGMGVAIVPGTIVNSGKLNTLSSYRIIRPSVPRNLSVVFKRGIQLPPTAKSFIEILS